jgi:ABC-2 type transport system permease protein
MTRHLNKLQAAFVIARRDYTATVFSRAFLFFLLGPQIRPAPPGQTPTALLRSTDQPVTAVLSDPFGSPNLTGKIGPDDALVGQVRLLLDRARSGAAPLAAISVTEVRQTAGATRNAREVTARAGQAMLFLLTLLLSGMLLSQLIEEKSNKVIEVLAAAVPVESIFIGKLFAMLAMSLTGIAVWLTAGLTALLLLAPGLFAALPVPAIGWPTFLVLGALYYAMSYLLIGAAFLGIGAQASTAREVQTLSMPITMGQVGLLLLANFAVSDPHGSLGIAAAAFPLSSPFAMIARAALDQAIVPHLAALLWQGLWVALILKLAAAWFRRSVLDSSGPRKRWWPRAAPSA